MEILILILFMALIISHAYRDHKDKLKKDQLYFCTNRLHCIALQFRDECMAETKKAIARYTASIDWKSYRRDWSHDFILDYRESINNLKTEYLSNYAMKYSGGDNRLRIEAEDLPTYIVDKYEAEVSEIASIFRDLGYFMQEQIEELKQEHK